MYHSTAPLAGAQADAHQFALYGQSARRAPAGSAAERLTRLVDAAGAAMGRA